MHVHMLRNKRANPKQVQYINNLYLNILMYKEREGKDKTLTAVDEKAFQQFTQNTKQFF